MYQSSTRMKRVCDLIQHELANILQRSVADPRLSHITLTAVQVSPDLKHAKIFFTILETDSPSKEKMLEIQKAFKKASGFLRSCLAANTALRVIPQLHFTYDQAAEQSSRLSQLINEAVADDEFNDEEFQK